MPENLVVGYDGSPSSRWALDWATSEAQRRRSKLTVLTVVDQTCMAESPPIEMVGRWEAAGMRAERRALEALRLVRAASPTVDVEGLPRVGAPVALLVRASHGAAVVAIGRAALRGAPDGRPGRVVEGLALRAHCPVVVVGQPDAAHGGPGRPVVVGVDGSRGGLRALDFAAASAAAMRAPLHIVCAWSPGATASVDSTPDERNLVDRHAAREAVAAAAARVRARYPHLRVVPGVGGGRPPSVLARYGRGAGLLVVGHRGLGAANSIAFGSVSRALMRSAPCPVAIVGLLTVTPTAPGRQVPSTSRPAGGLSGRGPAPEAQGLCRRPEAGQEPGVIDASFDAEADP